ncbi:MAG: BatD family protein [Sulfurimonas sp.]|nr:BatD family protein [Sulfurimonas sp.]
MKSLGKILFLLLFISNIIYASVVSNVNYSSVTKGEMVIFSLKINGNDIQRPIINTICDSDVISTSSQTSIEIVNGDYKKSYVLSYKFMPMKSCKIKPIDVEIDGKIETSKALEVVVKPMSQDKNADFILNLKTEKKEFYVGEPFEVTLEFKQKKRAEAVDSKFIAPPMKGFWIKDESKPERRNDGEYTITSVRYILAPQREGSLKIEPAQISIASRTSSRDVWGSFSPQIKWKSYFSNELDLNIKPIPFGASLVGEFTISAKADKTKISPNEAVNVTVEVHGSGNLEDIKTFKPYIEDVSVFDEKILVKGMKLTQKLALVGDNDFVIPPFKLKFFNPKTNKIETVSTSEIKVEVLGAKVKPELKIKRDETGVKEEVKVKTEVVTSALNPILVSLVFVLGIVFGIVLMILKPWSMFKREKSLNIKDEKLLLVKLLPFKDDKEVQDILDILENNLYSQDKKKIDKKVLKELLKKYEIS